MQPRIYYANISRIINFSFFFSFLFYFYIPHVCVYVCDYECADITIELRALGVPWTLHCWMHALAAAHELRLDTVIDQLLQDFLQVCPDDYSQQFVTECLPLLFSIFRYSKVCVLNNFIFVLPLFAILSTFLPSFHSASSHSDVFYE